MSETNFIFLPAILFLGAVTSYQDIRLGKIRHKWIVAGVIYSLLGYLLLSLPSILRSGGWGLINYSYIRELLLNGFISISVAYFLWKLGLWAAGDAKLFIVYTLLIPLDYYSQSYFPYFPSFALLLNIFIPLFLSVLIIALWELTRMGLVKLINYRNGILNLLKEAYHKAIAKLKSSRRDILGTLVSYTAIFLGLQLLMGRLRLSPLWALLPALIMARVISRGVKNGRNLLAAVIILFAYLAYQIGYLHRLSELIPVFRNLIRLLLIFGILRGILNLYFRYTQVYKIDIRELKPRMLLSEEPMKQIQREARGSGEELGTIYPDGLSESQAERIKNMYIEKGQQTIEICRTFPLAIWMFLGVLLTLAFKQSVLHMFR